MISSLFGARPSESESNNIDKVFLEIHELAAQYTLNNAQQQRATALLQKINALCHYLTQPAYRQEISLLSALSESAYSQEQSMAIMEIFEALEGHKNYTPPPSLTSSGLHSSQLNSSWLPPSPSTSQWKEEKPAIETQQLKRQLEELQKNNAYLTSQLHQCRMDLERLRSQMGSRGEVRTQVGEEFIYTEAQKLTSFHEFFDGMLGKIKELEDLRRKEEDKLTRLKKNHAQEIEVLKIQLSTVSEAPVSNQKLIEITKLLNAKITEWHRKLDLSEFLSLEEELSNANRIEANPQTYEDCLNLLRDYIQKDLTHIFDLAKKSQESQKSQMTLLADQQSRLNDKIDSLEKEAKVREKRSNELEKSNQELALNSENLEKALQNVPELQNECAKLKEQLTESKRAYDKSQDEIMQLNETIIDMECKFTRLEEKYQATIRAFKKADSRLKEFEGVKEQMESLEEELEGAHFKIKNTTDSNRSMLSNTSKRISELEERIRRYDDEVKLERHKRELEEEKNAKLKIEKETIAFHLDVLNKAFDEVDKTEKTNLLLKNFINTLSIEIQNQLIEELKKANL